MADRTPWPSWARYTATAALGASTTLVGITLAFGDVKRDAADAKKGVEQHEPRIQSVERITDRWDRDLPEMRADVKELLRRIPK